MLNFKDKTSLITGASSGIGEAISYRLAQCGSNVILTGLGEENLNKIKSKCESFGVKAYALETDVSDTNSIDNLVNFTKSNNIHINIFVLNAGISQRAITLDTDFNVDKKILNINFFGAVYLIKQFKDMLLASKYTSIAVTTSMAGLFGFPLRSAYCASKHALFGFFESMALEYSNIHVTFLIPGRINTQISKSAMLGSGEAYKKMDPGQANGLDVNICAKRAVRAIAKGKRRKLLGKYELIMVYINKFLPGLYFKLSKNISAT